MNSSVKNEIVCSNNKGNSSTFIKKIIGEMKYKFNKSEHKNGIDKSEVNKFDMDVNQMQENLEGGEKIISQYKDSEIKHEDVVQSQIFKRPHENESQPTHIKRLSLGKRSCSYEQDNVKNIIKRSSRRRSKDSSESILQSAIARKEKSYNETNKPQRLSRQLKLKSKTMENVSETKIEKTGSVIKNDLQHSDEASASDEGVKKLKKTVKLSKKKTKPKTNFKDKTDTDSLESLLDDGENLRISRQSYKNNAR